MNEKTVRGISAQLTGTHLLLQFGEGGDSHGLVMQFAVGVLTKGRDLTIGIETGDRTCRPKCFPGGPDLFCCPFLQDAFATHTTDEDGEFRRFPDT